MSSTSQALMLRMGCLFGPISGPSNHDAMDLDKVIRMSMWMSLASQVLRLDRQLEDEGRE